MKICDRIQQTIAEEGLESIERDSAARGHVQSCPQCARLVKSFTELESSIEQLPQHDAPDALVGQTLRAVADAGEPGQTPARTATHHSYWAPALASAAVIVATLGLTYHFVMPFDPLMSSDILVVSQTEGGFGSYRAAETDNKPKSGFGIAGGEQQRLSPESPAPASSARSAVLSTEPRKLNKDLAAGLRTENYEAREKQAAQTSEIAEEEALREGDRTVANGNIVAQLETEVSGQELGRKRAELETKNRRSEGFADDKRLAQDGESLAMSEAPEPTLPSQPGADLLVIGETGAGSALGDHRLDLALLIQSDTPVRDYARPSEQNEQHGARTQPQSASEAQKSDVGESSGDDAIDVSQSSPVATEDAPQVAASEAPDEDGRLEIATSPTEIDANTASANMGASLNKERIELVAALEQRLAERKARNRQIAGIALAKQFLAELERREGLTFQPATGYWANTYVPGDPAMRLLQARLASWDRGAMSLDKAAQPIWQPFDIPRDAALGVHLQADKRAVSGPSRLRVQIGLQGSQRRGGQRPAVNVGVVLDLRGASGKRFAHEFRALLMALAKARQPGDRFVLTVAGAPGGLVLTPDEFRHGPLTVAMRELFATNTPESHDATLNLTQATALAARTLQLHADAEATLGASQVLLVSGASIANELPELQALAHANAISGIPLSVISVGGAANLDNIDRLVLAGQGSRRILTSAAQAESVIDKELYSTSRVVARAVRLRIRLAPGVQLVDVLGSRRLSDPQAQRVREAEQGIDQRLSRNLGIQADRGEDEEGIQIVIPAMEANTSHVVLLDVLTDRPGPIADVTVRYKDLVYLRNGVSRAQLTVDRGTQAPGPLERNVLKNLVALELANTARRASQLLAQGNPAAAASTLNTARELLAGMRDEIGEWKTDKELAADETMLIEYVTLLQSQGVADAQQRRYLMDSLHLSAFRKLLPTDRTSAAAGE